MPQPYEYETAFAWKASLVSCEPQYRISSAWRTILTWRIPQRVDIEYIAEACEEAMQKTSKRNFTGYFFLHFLLMNSHLAAETLQLQGNLKGALIATVRLLQVGFSAHHQLDCVGSLKYFIQCIHNFVPAKMTYSLSACFASNRNSNIARILVDILDLLAFLNSSSVKCLKTPCSFQDKAKLLSVTKWMQNWQGLVFAAAYMPKMTYCAKVEASPRRWRITSWVLPL